MKIFLLIFILVPTFINNYIEIKHRKITKPEFTKFFDKIELSEFNSLVINAPNRELKLVENYIKTLKEFKSKKFKIYNLETIPAEKKMIWVVCYEPLVGFNCKLLINKINKWQVVDTKQYHLLNLKLYKTHD